MRADDSAFAIILSPQKRSHCAPHGGLTCPPWVGKCVTNHSKIHPKIIQLSPKIHPKSFQIHPESIQNRCLERACQNGCQKRGFWIDFGIHYGCLFVPFSLKNQNNNPKGPQMPAKIWKTASKNGRQKTMPKIRRNICQKASKMIPKWMLKW